MAQERPLKRARLEESHAEKGHSYYKVIAGTRYDRELLNQAEGFAKDGQISCPEAQRLWESAEDGHGVTHTEKNTLEYITKHFKFTEKALSFMQNKLDSGAHSSSYYHMVEGIKCDRGLLKMAEGFAQDGQVSVAEAKKLWDAARDGPGITHIERQTLQYTLRSMKYTAKAAQFLQAQLEALDVAPHQEMKCGLEYDHDLLQMAAAFAKDGQVSFPEAQKLLEAARGSTNIPEIEARTLLYTLTAFKYTDKARRLVDEALQAEASSLPAEASHPEVSSLPGLNKIEKKMAGSDEAFSDVLKHVMRRTRCEERGFPVCLGGS